jgi:hypothetical protein
MAAQCKERRELYGQRRWHFMQYRELLLPPFGLLANSDDKLQTWQSHEQGFFIGRYVRQLRNLKHSPFPNLWDRSLSSN